MKNKILSKIKSRGYWQINFRPKVFIKNSIPTLSQCREIVQKSIVELRGWDYPHFPSGNDDKQEIYNCNDYIESWIDWGCFKEAWRMYQSTQFIHFFGMLEDWYEEDDFFVDRKNISPGTTLDMIHAIYRITEVYEFLKRLTKHDLYLEGVEVDIKLYNTKNRKIVLTDPGRIPLWDSYISRNHSITFFKSYYREEIIDASEKLALEMIVNIFEQFNWNNPPIETIKNDQSKLIERKF